MDKPYVAVVGGVNVDLCGKAFAPLIPADSNPGEVRVSLGGVGRNMAHNLCLLGVPTTMLTALARDGWAELVRSGCAAAGIDLSHAKPVPEGKTSAYLAIEGPEGDLALALCDNSLARSIDPLYLAQHLELLNGAAAVVLDTNLEPEALEWLAERVTAPLFADPVSVTKAEKLRPILGRLFLLKPNRIEAELLSGVEIRDRNSLELAAAKLLSTGLRRVCVSLGREGVYCAWDTERCLAPCPETKLVNASGGGDAMMAGFVRAFLDGLPIAEAAAFALACSALAVESPETVNPALTLQAATRRATVGAVTGRPDPVGAVTGRPDPVGAVTDRPDPVGAVTGRPDPVGAVTGRSDPVGAVTGRPDPAGTITGRPDPVGAVIGRPDPVGAVTGRPDPVGAVTGRPVRASSQTHRTYHPPRKENRLKSYDYRSGGAYHVTICTNHRRCLFGEVYDAEDTQAVRLSAAGRIVESAILSIPTHYPTVELIRFCVMPNHVHLLLGLTPGGDNPTVSWVVNQLKGAVTKQIGSPVWQKGFYDHVIRTEQELFQVDEYIEHNPAKWKTDDYYVSPS